MRMKQRTTRSSILGVAVLLAFLAAWQVAAVLADSPFLPGVTDALGAFADLALRGDLEGYSLLTHVAVSLTRIASGFSLACLLGIPLGLVMGLYPSVYRSARTVIEPIRFIPPIAWIPIVIVAIAGFSRYLFIIWLGAFFPILISTLAGVPRVNPVHLDVARVHGASRGYLIRRVVVPSILPEIFSGMRVGLGVGWMTIVAAEMLGGENIGLGRLVLKYAELFKLDYSVAGMVLIGLLGLLLNEAFIQAEKRFFRWRWEVTV